MDLSRRPEYFEALHADAEDPWQVDSSWYEQRKAQLVLAVLPRRRYARGCEPGSSIGSLTERLAQRCTEMVATDVSPTALDRLRSRMPAGMQVAAELMSLPDLPAGTYDLVVLSEVLNYLSTAALDTMVQRLPSVLRPEADVVLAHRMKSVPGQPVTGKAAHQAFLAVEGFDLRTEIQDRHFRISCLRWQPGAVSDDDPPQQNGPSEAGGRTDVGTFPNVLGS